MLMHAGIVVVNYMSDPNKSLTLQACNEALSLACQQSRAFREGTARTVEVYKAFVYNDVDLYHNLLGQIAVLDETKHSVSFRASKLPDGHYDFSIETSLAVTSNEVPPDIFKSLGTDDRLEYMRPKPASVEESLVQDMVFSTRAPYGIYIQANRVCTVAEEEIYSSPIAPLLITQDYQKADTQTVGLPADINILLSPGTNTDVPTGDAYEELMVGSLFDQIMRGNSMRQENDLMPIEEAYGAVRVALQSIRDGYFPGCEGFTVELARPIEDYFE